MALDNERDLAYRILYKCLEEGAFSNLAMKGEEVTDFVTAAIYGTITYCYSLDFIINLASRKDVNKMDPRTRTIIRLGAWQIVCSDKVPDYAAVDTSVSLAQKYARSSKGFVNAVLHKVADLSAEQRDLDNYKPEVAVSLKSEIWGVFKKDYGKERALSICKAFLNTQPMTVRFDSNKTTREEIARLLEADGVVVNDSQFMDCALTVKVTNKPIDATKAWNEGKILVQGESAMLASLVADPKPGMTILDSCAAPGGKTTHLAELAGDNCHIDALEINSSRVDLIKQNADRMGITSIHAHQGDASSYGSGTTGGYDLVTADVPCSGLGLISKKPDIRLQMTYERITELLDIQANILKNAANNVNPGGVLVYSTCTVDSRENELQVQRFLEENEDFYSEDITQYLPDRLYMDDRRAQDAKNGYITLLPDTDKCDGFFIARLRRR